MSHDHMAHEGAKKLYELIKDVRIAMMTTVGQDGSLESRPMYNHSADEHGDLWFFTRNHSGKTDEISRDGDVNLGYSDPDGQNYVSVSGKAKIVRDQAKIKELWSEGLRTWFPKGSDDPEIALIQVHPQKGQYWDAPSSKVLHVYGYVKAAVTGEAPDPGDHKKVDLKG